MTEDSEDESSSSKIQDLPAADHETQDDPKKTKPVKKNEKKY